LKPALAALASLCAVALALPAHSGTLDRIRQNKKLVAGYRADARPLSYEESGHAEGYSVSLCEQVALALRAELGLAKLPIQWVKVESGERFEGLQSGRIDLLCGAASDTLERRKQVSFSLPIYLTGISVLVRSDAPASLQRAFDGEGDLARLPIGPVFSAQQGTTAAAWLAERGREAKRVPVASYAEGVERVLAGTSDALFGDRAILLDTISRNPRAGELAIMRRLFTEETIALASARGDADFQLAVDRALSHMYRTPKFWEIYGIFFGKPDADARTFFLLAARPD